MAQMNSTDILNKIKSRGTFNIGPEEEEFILGTAKQGLNEEAIVRGLNAKKNLVKGGEQTTTTTTRPSFQMPDYTINKQQITQPTQQKGFVSSFVSSLVDQAMAYPKYVGEAVLQADRVVRDPAWRKLYMGKELTQAERDKVTGDKTTFLLDPEQIETREDIAITGSKATAAAASFVVPGGTTVKGAAAMGALSGAFSGFYEGDTVDVDKVIVGALGGSVGGAGFKAVSGKLSSILGKDSKVYKNIYSKIAESSNDISEEAAKRINKATPSMWQKAIEDHGIDLNKLTDKYFKRAGAGSKTLLDKAKRTVELLPFVKGSGVGYDDLLGPVAKRGRGGLLKKEIADAESVISKTLQNVNKNTKITIDEVTKALNAEKKLIAKMPGNEGNIAALDEFITSFSKQYGKGITPKRALELKRIADSQFGRAVADENTGSAVAQAQKMVANALRGKLKKLFPEIKDALDTQSEVFTLQPVLNRARAILNTQGSEIRVGSLRGKSVFELLNPMTLMDSALSDPKKASNFLQPEMAEKVASGVIKSGEDIWSNAITNLSAVSGAVGLQEADKQSVGGQMGGQMGAELPAETGIPTSNVNATTIPPSVTPTPSNPFGGLTKRQVMAIALSEGATLSEVKEIGEIFELIGGDNETISQETIKIADSLRGEYLRRSDVNGTVEVMNAYKKIGNTPETPAGDMALIFSFMRILDPGSVVRETEQEMAQRATSLPGQLQNYAMSVASGRRLNAKQRQQFIEAAETYYQGHIESQRNLDKYYLSISQRYGVDPSLIGIGSFSE